MNNPSLEFKMECMVIAVVTINWDYFFFHSIVYYSKCCSFPSTIRKNMFILYNVVTRFVQSDWKIGKIVLIALCVFC